MDAEPNEGLTQGLKGVFWGPKGHSVFDAAVLQFKSERFSGVIWFGLVKVHLGGQTVDFCDRGG